MPIMRTPDIRILNVRGLDLVPSRRESLPGRRAQNPVRHPVLAAYVCASQNRSLRMAKAKSVTIYGIKNCDTMKKARSWLEDRKVAAAFHDYKASGVTRDMLEGWVKQVGWETLLNRSGTTFRKLPEESRAALTEKKAIALMLEQPSMIKRPVLDIDGKLTVGFKPEIYEKAVG